MKEPNVEHQKKYNKRSDSRLFNKFCKDLSPCRERPVVPVVIDPVLGRHLRTHQIEGELVLRSCTNEQILKSMARG